MRKCKLSTRRLFACTRGCCFCRLDIRADDGEGGAFNKYVAVIVQSRLASLDRALEEAAMDLGGRPFAVNLDITLPLIMPAMGAGWLLAFTLSLDDLVISSFVAGAGASTLPMVIFSKVKLGVTPEINALATIIIGIVMLGVIIAGWMMLRQQRLLAKGPSLES